MSDAENVIGSRLTIEGEVQGIREHIRSYHMALNAEGIWLFLATLGCWSVGQPILQLCAYMLTLWLFGFRMSSRSTETRSFPRIFEDLRIRIAALAKDEQERKAGLFDLIQVHEEELSRLTPFRRAKQFFLCWLFWGGSLIYCFWGTTKYIGQWVRPTVG